MAKIVAEGDISKKNKNRFKLEDLKETFGDALE